MLLGVPAPQFEKRFVKSYNVTTLIAIPASSYRQQSISYCNSIVASRLHFGTGIVSARWDSDLLVSRELRCCKNRGWSSALMDDRDNCWVTGWIPPLLPAVTQPKGLNSVSALLRCSRLIAQRKNDVKLFLLRCVGNVNCIYWDYPEVYLLIIKQVASRTDKTYYLISHIKPFKTYKYYYLKHNYFLLRTSSLSTHRLH
jgi:hypothetical protein